MKKKILMLFVLSTLAFLSGCSILTMTFDATTNTVSTTLPTTINGTISLGDLEYSNFSIYESLTYSISDIDAYNDILLETRDNIRHSNIQIVTSLYSYTKPYPWSTVQELSIIGASEGSGVIFLEDDLYYYALTNYHVVDGEADEIKYEIQTYSDVSTYEALLVAYDASYDLAVLKFLKEDRTDIYIIDYTTRLYTKYIPGELVFAVGNPLSLTNNVTIGEFKSMSSIANVEFSVIYHDASIHEGSSGGALTDVDGHLLGLNTWGLDTSDQDSFAVPIYIIYTFLVNYGII